MKTLTRALLTLTFSAEFSRVLAEMYRFLAAYRLRFLLVCLFSIFVVVADLLSAGVVAAVAVGGGEGSGLSLPLLGPVENPLAGVTTEYRNVVAIATVLALQLLREGLLYANGLLAANLGIAVNCFAKGQVSETLLGRRFADVARYKRNDLIVHGTNFSNSLANFASDLTLAASSVVIMVFYALSILVLEPGPFLVIATVVLLLMLVTNRMVTLQQGLGDELRSNELVYHEQIQDAVFGLAEIWRANQQPGFARRIRTLIEELRSARWRTALLKLSVTPLQRVMALLVLGGALIGVELAAHGADRVMSFERMVLVLFLVVRVYGPVSQLNSARSSLMVRVAPTAEILGFLRGEVGAHARAAPPPGGTDASAEVTPADGDIRFEDVSYHYEQESAPALRGVSFVLPRGRVTALVGPSGAGKSTVVELLTKLREPTAGRLLAGEVDLAHADASRWRSRLAVMAQQGHVFHGTVAENITLFRSDFTRDEVESAARRANLLEFVHSLPDGLDTRVGGPDTAMSGGQRQRLLVARALLVKPDLLVLDEATSAQDALSEERLLETLRRELAGVTVLMIAHRFSAIREVDQIIVLDEGRVVERGNWQSLAQGAGLFQRLLHSQRLHTAAHAP